MYLAGDAAYIHSSAAQGKNTGVHDATDLWWRLKHATPLMDRFTIVPGVGVQFEEISGSKNMAVPIGIQNGTLTSLLRLVFYKALVSL